MIVETFEKSWYDTTNFTKTAISINNNFNNNERQWMLQVFVILLEFDLI